jgi:DNA-binding helix-hairpin-helix protein with protein kinase domain
MPRYCLYNSGEQITLGSLLARGGEACLFSIIEHPELIAKLHTPMTPEISDKLMVMVSAPPPNLTLGGGNARLAWPIDLIVDADAGNTCGYPHPRRICRQSSLTKSASNR